jgi:hypothetical protein
MEDDLNLPIEEVEEVEMENEHGGSFSLCISDDDDGSNLHGVPLEGNVSVPLDDVSIVVPTVEEDAQKLASKRKPRRKTSVIWNDFSEVERGGVKKHQCNWCKSIFSVTRSSTTTQLHRHLLSCLPYIASKKKQKLLVIDSKGGECDGAVSVTNFSYDQKKVRELASHMILYHEYPFKHMEHVLFNKFMRANTPHWQKISRQSAKTECIKTYENEKKKLKIILRSVNKVNITTDMWTSGQKVSYMVVTGHFIDSNWILQRRVLNFFNVPPPHTGVIINHALQKCFQEWGIENKISTITVDNARNNDAALRILRNDFSLKKTLSVGGRLFHVRCCAHITNLLVQDGISVIKEVISCVRDGIKYLVASEGRMIQFRDICTRLQLPSKKLFLDVPTRWNSTYNMLIAALEFREVFPRYSDMDENFRWSPTIEEWEMVEKVCQVLEVFNDVTNIMSGSDYPTANLFLSEVWRIKEILTKKSRDENHYIKAMAEKMNLKFEKYWGECNLLMAIAAVLDPRFKMKLIQYCFPLIYPEPDATKNIEYVLSVLHELFDEYVKDHNSVVEQIEQVSARECSSSGSSNVVGIGRSSKSGKEMFESFVRTVDLIQPMKSDLDIYLEESVFICEEGSSEEFNALEWWKATTLKFHILSKMARDILSIPITTVASESAFSAGSRVIDPYRASLSTETIQMLLCGADWVRVLHGITKSSKVMLYFCCVYYYIFSIA